MSGDQTYLFPLILWALLSDNDIIATCSWKHFLRRKEKLKQSLIQ